MYLSSHRLILSIWVLSGLMGGIELRAQADPSLNPGLQSQVFNVTRYSTDEGLTQSQVMALWQDRLGYLWLGTHRGLDRFDGQHFTHYGPEEGMRGTFLSEICEDQIGHLWILSDIGITTFDGIVFKDLTLPEVLPLPSLSCLANDQQGKIWLGTNNQGLWQWDADSFRQEKTHLPGLDKGQILSLYGAKDHSMWVGTRQGAYQLTDSSLTFIPGLEEIPILSIHESSQGKMFFGTEDGLFQYANGTSQPIKFPADLDDRRVYAMAVDGRGRLWIGTGNGVGYLDPGSTQLVPLQRNDGLLRVRLTDAVLDREDNVWFGTDGGGIRKITEGVFATYGIKDGFSSNLAKSFLEDEQGRIWASTKDRGINVYDGQRVVKKYTSRTDGIGGDDICYSFEDSRGAFWFASYNGTLTRYQGGVFRVFDAEDGLICGAAYCVVEQSPGNYLIGTDVGVYRYDGQHISLELTTAEGLPSNVVYQILPDKQGDIWIGTANGLAVQSPRASTVTAIGDSVLRKNILTLVEDPAGRIWAGSSTGLVWVEDRKAYPLRISGAAGASTIVSLIIDNEQHLWIGTENGAYRLNVATFDSSEAKLLFEHYTQKDGLPSLECNANAAFIDRRNNLWIGTAEGAIMRPANTLPRPTQRPPLVYISHVLGLNAQGWQAGGYSLGDDMLPDRLVLPYSENRLTFQFIGISLRSPKQVEYRVKLEGQDKDWQKPLGTAIPYTNLKPGKYTFLVTAKLQSEPWDYGSNASFSFVIESPIYQQWWFLLLAFAIVSFTVWFIANSIINRRQQERERQRIRNTAEKLQLEHQALYAMMNPHFTFNALQSIQNFIQQNDKKSAHKFLSRFAKLVRKNLDSTKEDFISLNEEVDRLKLYLDLEKMRFPEKFDYEVRISPEIDAYEIQIPPMLLQPFVENSIKHGIMPLSSDGMISIDILPEEDDYMRILIQDNGIGIKASKAMQRNRPSDHVSKGMKITQDRLELFARMTEKGYALDIREETDEVGEVIGTLVDIKLPMHFGELTYLGEA